jgi:hypothetical protein
MRTAILTSITVYLLSFSASAFGPASDQDADTAARGGGGGGGATVYDFDDDNVVPSSFPSRRSRRWRASIASIES